MTCWARVAPTNSSPAYRKPARAAAQLPPAQDELLALQRTGGNRAVTGLLAGRAPVVQRACNCCVEDVRVENIKPSVDKRAHDFDFVMDVSYHPSAKEGECEVEWWEKTNRVYSSRVQGDKPDTWSNVFANVERELAAEIRARNEYGSGSAMKTDLTSYTAEELDHLRKNVSGFRFITEEYLQYVRQRRNPKDCAGQNRTIRITDGPGLGLDPNAERYLDFLLIGKSGKAGSCAHQARYVTASQFLKIANDKVEASDFRANVSLTEEAVRHRLRPGMDPEDVLAAVVQMIGASRDTALHPRYVELLWTFYLRDDLRPPGVSFSEIQQNLTRSMELLGQGGSPLHQRLNRDVVNLFAKLRR
ncbi:MAG TPA: hypothetical protein VMU51_00740 [Mycobacteriales bacterium]|nr:hypothetical protein [Mycobacteriales bacterium]